MRSSTPLELVGSRIPPPRRDKFFRLLADGFSLTAAAKQAGISKPTAIGLRRQMDVARQLARQADPDLDDPDAPRREKLARRSTGLTTSQATRATGRAGNGNPWANQYLTALGEDLPPPIAREDLSPSARSALDDFELFRRRYLGRVSLPWQTDAAYRVVDLLASARATYTREFLVVNAPPGSGKSTLFTQDLSLWLICRNRAIRIMIGSRTSKQAMKYTRRIRRALQQRSPAPPRDEDLQRGMAVVPQATLVGDYGRFKPQGRNDDVWQQGGFTVVQADELLTTEKEPTVTAFGFDSDYLGMRVDLVIWDDLVDPANTRTLDVIESLQETWDQIAEPRADPGGLTVLQGQRIRHNDLYRYCLDKRRAPALLDEPSQDSGDDAADEPPEVDPTSFPAKYHHVVYRAHDETLCGVETTPRGAPLHWPSSPPWSPPAGLEGQFLRGLFATPAHLIPPRGCLLDPRRLPWRDLRTLEAEDPDVYRVVYQQEDLDPSTALIRREWVDGGRDPRTGALLLGCWDNERGEWELPPAPSIPPPNHLSVTIDPSPSNWWAVQCWLYNPQSERRFLIAAARERMDAPALLDWDADHLRFTGLLEDWWQHSTQRLGMPLRFIVVEVNTAQKWLLQYDHARRWAQHRGVNFVPHTTGLNKTDSDRGIPAVAPHWRTGRIRLPGHPTRGRPAAELLVREMLRWRPKGTDTDDQVMAHWFNEFSLPKLAPQTAHRRRPATRPSWLRSA